MKRLVCIGLLVALSMAAAAQGGTKYDRLILNKSGFGKFAKGRLSNMGGGVDITLTPIDPQGKPLRLQAEEMTFAYPDAETKQANHVEMKRNVHVDSEDGTISSDQAVLDLAKETIIFTGKVKLAGQDLNMDAATFTMDLATGDMSWEEGTANFSLSELGAGGEGAAGAAYLLRIEDVRDWKGLLSKVKAQAGADKPSPGKRIAGLLPEDVRAGLFQLDLSQEPADGIKKTVVKEFNKVLDGKSIYDKASWEGVKIDAATAALLGKSAASREESIQLNRGLLDAAFPAEIAKRSAQ